MRKTITLQEFIMDTQAEFPFVSGQLTRLLTDIGVAAKIVNHQVNRAGLAGAASLEITGCQTRVFHAEPMVR